MGSVNLSGTLQGSDAGSGGGGSCCGGTGSMGTQYSTGLGFAFGPKSFNNASGILKRTVADNTNFLELSAIGDGRDVPAANFFYLKTTTPFELRLTLNDGIGGTTVIVIPIQGLFLYEAKPTNEIVLAEVKGVGTLEYFASGN